MTFDTVHTFSLLNATEIDSKSLAHHARNAEAILNKIPNELQKLIQLRSVTRNTDQDGEQTELQRNINEHLDYVIKLSDLIYGEKAAREIQLRQLRNEFRQLVQRFERLSHYCLAKLPTVVQKEHENVASTLVKLRWCISQAEEERGLLSARVHTLEAFNHKLDADIERLSGCTSLANEKFVVEHAEMERIARETEEARKQLTNATDQLNSAEIRLQVAQDRAVRVREELANELASIESRRKEARLKLADAQATEPRLIAQTKALLERTQETESRATRMKAELAECIKQVATGIQTVSHMMQENETGHKLLESLNYWLRRHQQLLDTRFNGKFSAELDAARKRHLDVTDRVSALRLECLDVQTKIRIYLDRIAKSEKAIQHTKEDIDRLKKRILETTNSLAHSTNRLSRVQTDHEKVMNKLEETKQTTRAQQDRMRKQINEVDERIKEEMAIRTNLLAGIKRDNQELEDGRAKALSERNELQIVVAQLREEVTGVEKQTDGVRAEHAQFMMKKRTLSEQYETLQNQWKEKRDSLNAESDRIENCTKEKRELLNKLTDQLQQLRSHKEKLTQDKEMVRKNIEAMLKVNVRTEDSWGQAKCSLAEFESNQRAFQCQFDSVFNQTQCIDTRQRERNTEYHELFQSRQTALDDFKMQLKKALNENSLLAKSYQTNQSKLKQQIHAFYAALNELAFGQWELNDAEQLVILCSRTMRYVSIEEERLQSGPLLVILQLSQHWNAVSCRMRVIQKHSENRMAITAPVDQSAM